MVEVNDPQLLGTTPSAQWRVGSAVEVYSNSDTQWLVGCIVSEDPNGSQLLCILFGDSPAQLKQKQLPRGDVQLAVVGTHVRRTPPGWEVFPGPQLVQPSSGRRCSSLEEAWAMHFEHVKTQVQLQTVRFAGPAQRGTALLVPAAQPPPLQQPVSPQATNGIAHAQVSQSDSITVSPGPQGGEPEAHAGADQLSSRLIEAEERAEAAQAKVQQLLSELEQVREERDAARRELREALAEIERASRSVPVATTASAQGSPVAPGSLTSGALATPPPVPSSWQPPLVAEAASASMLSQSPVEEALDDDAIATDGSLAALARPLQPAASALQPLASSPVEAAAPLPVVGSARERRHTENPVDVVVSVPRALTTEEMFEQQERERRVPPPSRSLRSLAQNMSPSPVQNQVQRLPSAPVSAMSQCGVTLATTHSAIPKAFPQMAPSSTVAMQAGGIRQLIPHGGGPSGAALPSAPASLAAPPGGTPSRFLPQRHAMAPMHGMPQVVPQQQAYWSSYAPMR